MGAVKEQSPVLRLLVAFSRHSAALDWAQRRGEEVWGPIEMASPVFQFDDTSYYDATMGAGLLKQLTAFRRLMRPEDLPETKLLTNDWESEYRQTGSFEEARPLNLDPGYLTQAKLVLATTKDRDHRIYLSKGIFAEVTLHFHGGQWCSRPWTYPDYGNGQYFEFLTAARQFLRRAI